MSPFLLMLLSGSTISSDPQLLESEPPSADADADG